ncbi:MAG: peptide-methionine (R)-S-oxide reductase MsrB [Nitrosomonas sp.]|nr:MAG: peptide-methionine (R)-S-oxide reductase MsrB [Nitrosomonas sp.]
MINWSQILMLAKLGNPPPPQRVEKTESEWQSMLTDEQYFVLRQKGTEPPHSSKLCTQFEPGLYACSGCSTVLFDASSKFNSGTGWPSFTQPVAENVVAYYLDTSYGMQRIEVNCNICGGHLGHAFPDGPEPSGLRFCINALSLKKV